MIPQSTINACVKAYYGSMESTDYGKIQAVLLAYESITRASEAGDCQMCIRCGQPTMHIGNLCFGCTKAIAAAPAPGGGL